MAQLFSEQDRIVTAVCKISRKRGRKRESVGQGCLVQAKQSNECCVVTVDTVISDGPLGTYEVEFTKKDSKPKRFSLKDIIKEVKSVSGLVKIVIDLNSPKLKHGDKTCSVFTESPLTITALDKSKKQFCCIDKKCYNLQVSHDSTIEFPDHAPSTIPNGLVILQTLNSTDINVIAVRIQSQVDGNQEKTIWMNEILEAGHTAATSSFASGVLAFGHGSSKGNQDPSASLVTTAPDTPPNPESTGDTASNQTPTNVFESHRRPYPTELSYRSYQAPASTSHFRPSDNVLAVAHLPPVNGKENSTMMKVKQYDLVSHRGVTDGQGFTGSTSNIGIYQGKQSVDFPLGYDDQGRRHSFPNRSPKKREQRKNRSFSGVPTKMERNIKLEDPLAETILDNLALLEKLSRCLDKEHEYGRTQCWKHIAEHFGIDEKTYQSFKCSKIHSPTQAMFEYLQATDTNITIGKLKEKLRSVKRQDVIDVLVACEKINDGTLVCSLFDSNPDIIGRIAFLLDRQKKGSNNWVELAEKLGIPKDVSKGFETCNTYNPTAGLFEHLKIHLPKMTVEELITDLKAMQRHDVVTAIKKSTKVKNCSLIRDLMGDLFVMDNVCELLNRKPITNKVLGWKHLGALLEIDADILDDLSPPQVYECPTEALIRYLGSWKPDLKIADFVRALDMTDRPDAVAVLEGYLPVGCVSELRRS